jgi:hypothetical protein
MKNIANPTAGKILVHDKGLGGVTEEQVEKRARELAIIDNREGPSAVDRVRARAELTGKTLPPTSGEELSSNDSLSRDPSDPPAQRGRQVPNFEGLDEEKATERLVSEGVEEAQHEQMLAARQKRSS